MSGTSTPPDGIGIRAVSELTGLSLDTLRWYERTGLLPDVGRGPDGRRRYSPLAVGFVRLVQVLRRTGMPVAEVREFVRLAPAGLESHRTRIALLERHAAAVEEQITRLRADQAAVRTEAARYRAALARGHDCQAEMDEQGLAP
ncbi:MerR family transcriptional regulator [Promicromonospora thailandica]|uniref:MerR family transcriptional regulator n=1 Tax=Promicromonospora thailandica TaxID=765201 RepID=UPI0020A58937|nr:MerR family transcriptional regulator [Promicromonospora thailandica]